MMNKKDLALRLFDLGVLQFGEFTLKSGLQSPFYLDFRRIVAYPDILKSISEQLVGQVKDRTRRSAAHAARIEAKQI